MNEKVWYASLQNDFQDVLSKKSRGRTVCMECYYFVTKEEQYERDVGEHLGHMMLVGTVAYLGNRRCAAVMRRRG